MCIFGPLFQHFAHPHQQEVNRKNNSAQLKFWIIHSFSQAYTYTNFLPCWGRMIANSDDDSLTSSILLSYLA